MVLLLTGWWYVEDRHGRTGWAPATYLGPVVDRARKASSSSKSSIIGKCATTVIAELHMIVN